ncbi:beta-lactamase [Alcanivorax balearicus MACL04]|uniref:Beta-lactamase n=1 Tax=Alloalcanivorax balearicus MACL04 TaxID=1177182 RepID=A0ABT2QZ38_9GAMM|nr:serine hydrolase domain-containing protein [Alloalcanivorax balearicus]MCU5782779.1 beta-lactamase [Alloalcanivorax balearicus MACL04]
MFDLVTPELVGISSNRLGRVDNWMRTLVASRRLAGISVLVYRRGHCAWFGGAGHLKTDQQQKIAEDTLFRIYSMTKPITSVAAMMLYEQGLFQLDDPIAKFLPEFTDMQVCVGGDEENPKLEPARSLITMRQLLTHTSGLAYDFTSIPPVDALYRKHGINFSRHHGSLAEMTRQAAQMPLLFHPGTKWNYSISTDVLGRVVEVISGQSLDRYFEEHIFAPLGMNDTAFWVAEEKLHRLAEMYTLAGATPPRIKGEPTEVIPDPRGALEVSAASGGRQFTQPPKIFSGGGGLTSTTGDYLRFALMLRNGGNFNGVRLLGRKTVELMHSNHLPGSMADMGEPRFNNTHMGAGLGFGLGFGVVLNPALAQTMGSVGEYFWTGMANTQFWIDPSEDLIVIQMAQMMPSTLVPIRQTLRSLVYQALID